MTIVPDECAETFVRALVDHFAAIGGIPLLAVFDRPTTIAVTWTKNGQVTEWNALFAGVALDLGLGIELCWPARPEQNHRMMEKTSHGRLHRRGTARNHRSSANCLRRWRSFSPIRSTSRRKACTQVSENRVLRLAAFQNPEFYEAQAMRLSTYYKPRVDRLR